MKLTESTWIPEERLLITRLSGDIDTGDVRKWERSLHNALAQIEDNSTFKIFVNLHGFKAVNIEAHKAMRAVIPLTLAGYNHRAGYVDLFEDVVLPLKKTRGISCLAAVHVHHDETKINEYARRFNKENERFTTDVWEAEEWINGVEV